MSYPRYMVFYTVNTSGLSSDVDRAGWEHFVERPRPGAWVDALDTKVVAEGEGPAGGGGAGSRRFSRSRGPGSRPGLAHAGRY